MKKNKKYIVNKKDFFLLLLIFPLTIISKFFQYSFLSKDSFIDSKYILSLIVRNVEKKGTAYYVTAEILKKVNIFHFTTLLEWSIMFAIVFSIISFLILLKNRNYKTNELFFIYLCIVLLNFYVLNLSKDIIQFSIFIAIYFICLSNLIKEKQKLFLSLIILLLESHFFRQYYILIAYGCFLTYYFFRSYINKKMEKFSVIKIVIIALLIFLIPIGISRNIYPAEFNRMLNARDIVTASLNANTEIHNLFIGNSFIIFCLNFIVNGFRILFPIELMIKGIKYFPFVFFQIWLTFILIKNIRYVKKSNILMLSLIMGYFLGSITYEPDFGSVVRHEITLMFFYIYLNHLKLNGGKSYEE